MISKLAEFIEIKTPGKLDQVISSLKDLIQQGVIKEVSGNCKLSELIANQPRPDFIEIEFIEHTTNYRFKLSVETYHGAGGSFKKM